MLPARRFIRRQIPYFTAVGVARYKRSTAADHDKDWRQSRFGTFASRSERQLTRSPTDVLARGRLGCAYAAEFRRRRRRILSASGNCILEELPTQLAELHSLAVEHCMKVLASAPAPGVVQALVEELLELKEVHLYPLAARLLVEGIARHEESLADFERKSELEERAAVYNYETAIYLLKACGRVEEARAVFEEAVGLDRGGGRIGWTELWQTPAVYVPGLRPVTPWWDNSELPLAKVLADNAPMIREELGDVLVKGGELMADPAYPALTEAGEWDKLSLYNDKRWDAAACKIAPRTVGLLRGALPGAAAGLPYIHHNTEEVCFFRMSAGTEVSTHNGGSNARLNLSLGLLGCEGAGIRVAGEARPWRSGEVLAFDDSCDHSAWHHGDEDRWVLAVGIMHPDLVRQPRIFTDAGKGRTEFESYTADTWLD